MLASHHRRGYIPGPNVCRDLFTGAGVSIVHNAVCWACLPSFLTRRLEMVKCTDQSSKSRVRITHHASQHTVDRFPCSTHSSKRCNAQLVFLKSRELSCQKMSWIKLLSILVHFMTPCSLSFHLSVSYSRMIAMHRTKNASYNVPHIFQVLGPSNTLRHV